MFRRSHWQQVAKHHRSVRCVIHQCMAGLRDIRRTGLYIKRATEIWASSSTILSPLAQFVCHNNHLHCSHQEEERCAKDSDIWPWKLVEQLTHGICNRLKERFNRHYYPTASTDTAQDKPEDEEEFKDNMNQRISQM